MNIRGYGKETATCLYPRPVLQASSKQGLQYLSCQIKTLKSWNVCGLEPLDTWKAGLYGVLGFLSFEL